MLMMRRGLSIIITMKSLSITTMAGKVLSITITTAVRGMTMGRRAAAGVMTTTIMIITAIIMRMMFSQAGAWRQRRFMKSLRSRIFWMSWTVRKSTALCCVQKAWFLPLTEAGSILTMCPVRRKYVQVRLM